MQDSKEDNKILCRLRSLKNEASLKLEKFEMSVKKVKIHTKKLLYYIYIYIILYLIYVIHTHTFSDTRKM